MRSRYLAHVAFFCLLTALPGTRAAARCNLLVTQPVIVTMRGLRPTVLTEINGVKARFIIDTGASTSMLSPAAAAQYKLPLRDWLAPHSLWGMAMRMQDGPPHAYIQGFGGGEAGVKVATVRHFTYLGMTLSNVPFMVGGNTTGKDTVGLLGDNVLRLADTEYDFKDGIMRLVKPEGCGDRQLAYWAKPGQAVAVDTLRPFTAGSPQIIGEGSVNGHHISILFDSGAPESILSLAAARRAGITTHSPGVVLVGRTWGVAGDHTVKMWRAPIADLQIGTEKIDHTHLLIADFGDVDPDIDSGWADMLVGEDFFLSHHIFVAYNQRKLYFTYSGGPVFDMGLPSSEWKHPPAHRVAGATARPSADAAASPAPTSVAANAAATPGAASGTKTNAAELMRQGLAYAAQSEIHRALSDLERACRADPGNANCLYSLGAVYLRDKQPAQALKNFDAALRIEPNDVGAHLARAELRLARKGWPDAAAKAAALAQTHGDLNAVARLTAPQADVRLRLGWLYDDSGQYRGSIRQFKLWMRYHEHDIEMTSARDGLADARNNFCYHRAKLDRHLERALRDCTLALRQEPKSAAILDSNGLVNLRLGNLAAAVKDYDAALGRKPHQPTSLYGRGLAELRLGEPRRGNADLAAAAKLDRRVAATFHRMGLDPGQPAGGVKNN